MVYSCYHVIIYIHAELTSSNNMDGKFASYMGLFQHVDICGDYSLVYAVFIQI